MSVCATSSGGNRSSPKPMTKRFAERVVHANWQTPAAATTSLGAQLVQIVADPLQPHRRQGNSRERDVHDIAAR